MKQPLERGADDGAADPPDRPEGRLPRPGGGGGGGGPDDGRGINWAPRIDEDARGSGPVARVVPSNFPFPTGASLPRGILRRPRGGVMEQSGVPSRAGGDDDRPVRRYRFLGKNANVLIAVAALAVVASVNFLGGNLRGGPVDVHPSQRKLIEQEAVSFLSGTSGTTNDGPGAVDTQRRLQDGVPPQLRGYYSKMLGLERSPDGAQMLQGDQLIIREEMDREIREVQEKSLREMVRHIMNARAMQPVLDKETDEKQRDEIRERMEGEVMHVQEKALREMAALDAGQGEDIQANVGDAVAGGDQEMLETEWAMPNMLLGQRGGILGGILEAPLLNFEGSGLETDVGAGIEQRPPYQEADAMSVLEQHADDHQMAEGLEEAPPPQEPPAVQFPAVDKPQEQEPAPQGEPPATELPIIAEEEAARQRLEEEASFVINPLQDEAKAVRQSVEQVERRLYDPQQLQPPPQGGPPAMELPTEDEAEAARQRLAQEARRLYEPQQLPPPQQPPPPQALPALELPSDAEEEAARQRIAEIEKRLREHQQEQPPPLKALPVLELPSDAEEEAAREQLEEELDQYSPAAARQQLEEEARQHSRAEAEDGPREMEGHGTAAGAGRMVERRLRRERIETRAAARLARLGVPTMGGRPV